MKLNTMFSNFIYINRVVKNTKYSCMVVFLWTFYSDKSKCMCLFSLSHLQFLVKHIQIYFNHPTLSNA